MGELLYLYLEEKGLLDNLASSLVVERNVQLISKNKSEKQAYFEGSRYIDNEDFREYLDCYEYTYAVNTRFSLNNEVVFSYLTTKKGVSIEEEAPFDVYANEFATMDYFNAEGKEVVEYQKTSSTEGKEDYRLKHVCYNGESKSKAFRLPNSLRTLLSNEDNFATIICRNYGIDLHDYHNEKLRRQHIIEKIEIIDAEIARLERLKSNLLDGISLDGSSHKKM